MQVAGSSCCLLGALLKAAAAAHGRHSNRQTIPLWLMLCGVLLRGGAARTAPYPQT